MKRVPILVMFILVLTTGIVCFVAGRLSIKGSVTYVFIKVPTSGTMIADDSGYLATGFVGTDTVRFNTSGQFEMTNKSLLVLKCPQNQAVVPAIGFDTRTALVTCGGISDLVEAAKFVVESVAK